MNATDIMQSKTKRAQAQLIREAAARLKSAIRMDECSPHNEVLADHIAEQIQIAGMLERESVREESR